MAECGYSRPGLSCKYDVFCYYKWHCFSNVHMQDSSGQMSVKTDDRYWSLARMNVTSRDKKMGSEQNIGIEYFTLQCLFQLLSWAVSSLSHNISHENKMWLYILGASLYRFYVGNVWKWSGHPREVFWAQEQLASLSQLWGDGTLLTAENLEPDKN